MAHGATQITTLTSGVSHWNNYLSSVKKLLILTYHFPPFDVTASYRPYAYARFLEQTGFEVTVLTFDWPSKHTGLELPPLPKSSRVIRVPMTNPDQSTQLPTLWKVPLLSAAATAVSYTQGIFDYHVESQKKDMDKVINELLSKETFDLCMGIFSPHFHLEQCYRIHQKYGIPYVVDFRDVWNNEVLSDDYTPTLKDKWLNNTILKFWIKWMEQAAGWTTIAQALVDYLSPHFPAEGKEILNGFDPEDFEEDVERLDDLTIVHAGTIPEWKPIEPFFEGLALFVRQHPNIPVRAVFLGVTDAMEKRLNSLRSRLGLDEQVEFHPRIPKRGATNWMKRAHLLYYAPSPEVPGMYNTKFFDYIASGTPVLVCPREEDVIQKVLAETHTGFMAHTPSEVAVVLKKAAEALQDGHIIECDRIESAVNVYTRKHQAIKMGNYLNEVLKKLGK
jgi:glycosyltransferase involved in cell wall biosynthesis